MSRSDWSRWIGRLLVVTALLACGRSGTAQDAGQAAATPRAWDGQQEKPDAYTSFLPDLVAALNGHKRDLNREAFHFVVLYNVSRPNSGSEVRERDVFFGLLRFFLAGDDGSADKVSFVPYQLSVRQDCARWRLAFSHTAAEELYKQIPETAVAENNFTGGHNMDAALLTAMDDAQKQGLLNNTIFVALSESTFNEAPSTPPGYAPKDATQALARNDLVLEKANQQTWGNGSSTNKRIENKIVWRIYMARNLQPLGTFAHTRREGVAAIWGVPADPDWGAVTTPPVNPVVPPFNNGGDNTPPVKSIDPLPFVIGISVTVLVLAAIAYIFWLQKPRALTISGDTWQIAASVVYGKPLYLGSSNNGAKNIVAMAGLPEGMTPDTKLARVEIGPTGVINVISQTWNVEKSPVALSHEDKEVTLTERGASEMFSPDAVHIRIRQNAS